MKLDPAAFPLHRVAARAGQAGGGRPAQAEADQGVSRGMADVVPPEHHLLCETAGGIIEDEKGRWNGREHGGNFN